jgi:hypothetical protein
MQVTTQCKKYRLLGTTTVIPGCDYPACALCSPSDCHVDDDDDDAVGGDAQNWYVDVAKNNAWCKPAAPSLKNILKPPASAVLTCPQDDTTCCSHTNPNPKQSPPPPPSASPGVSQSGDSGASDGDGDDVYSPVVTSLVVVVAAASVAGFAYVAWWTRRNREVESVRLDVRNTNISPILV